MAQHEHRYDYDQQVGAMRPDGSFNVQPMCGCGQPFGPVESDRVL